MQERTVLALAVLVLLCLGPIAACDSGSEQDVSPSGPAATTEPTAVNSPGPTTGSSQTPAPSTPEGPVPVPGTGSFSDLSYDVISTELKPGAGCSVELEQGEIVLLAAVAQDALARLDGELIHLQAEEPGVPALLDGSTFSTPAGGTITVRPEPGPGRRQGESTVRAATVVVERAEGASTLTASYRCGA